MRIDTRSAVIVSHASEPATENSLDDGAILC